MSTRFYRKINNTIAISSVTVQGSVLENQLLIEKSTDLRHKIKGKMRTGRQSASQSHYVHFPHSLPVTLLWMGCSLLHFRPLPMSAERGGIRKFPVMPYSASQTRSPIHAHGMRQRRAKAEHSRPNTSKYRRLKPVWEWVWMKVLVHARVFCLLIFPGRSLLPGKSISPYEITGLKSLRK